LTAVNEITRDKIKTKPVTQLYSDGWDLIWLTKGTQESPTDKDKEKLLNGKG